MSAAVVPIRRAMDALGIDTIEQAREFLIPLVQRTLPRPELSDIRELLSPANWPRTPAQRGGDDHYDRPDDGPQGTGRPWRGARFSEPSAEG